LFYNHYCVYKSNISILAEEKETAMETIEKISITSKTLASGNCQVKFFVEDERQPRYGYLLMTEPKPVGDIINEIKNRLEKRRMEEMNLNPFFPLSPTSDDPNFYLFSA
jgi:hypothetical protein